MADILRLLIENLVSQGEISETDYQILLIKAKEQGLTKEDLDKLIDEVKSSRSGSGEDEPLGSGFIPLNEDVDETVGKQDSGSKFSSVELLSSQGAMSEVYRAKHFGRWVVLKRIKKEYRDNPKYKELFFKEFYITHELDHPNIVRALDIGEDDEGPYFTLEYVDGRPLRDLIKSNGLKDKHKALKIAKQILDALDYAHKKNIFHRDLKPENILITYKGDNVKILDFGLASADFFDDNLKTVGTPKYAAPEQKTRGYKADQRSDLYSAGIILLEMFTGKTDVSAIDKIENPQLRNIILKTTAKNPQDRYSSAEEMLKELEKVDLSLSEKKPENAEILPEKPSRKDNKKLIYIISGIVLLLLIVAGTWFFMHKGNSKQDNLLKRADSLYYAGNFKEALSLYSQIQTEDTAILNRIKYLKSAVSLYDSANALMSEKNYVRALKVFEKIMKKYPDFKQAKKKLSECKAVIDKVPLSDLHIVKSSASEKYGLADNEGNIIVDYVFDEIAPKKDWHKLGLIPVRCGKKWGFLDKNKRLFARCVYDPGVNGKYVWISQGFRVRYEGRTVIITVDRNGNGLVKE